MRKEFRDLASPAAAKEAVAALDIAPGAAEVALDDAAGRVLAERVEADLDVPGFDRAAMDGYAVRATDTFGADTAEPAVLDLAGRVEAGERPDADAGAGEAVEVGTGAVLPEGADAVVVVERTERRGEAVAVRTAVAPGENVMPAGADVPAGARVLGPGAQVSPREVGVLAALGRETVSVRGRPTVGVLSTGGELVAPGDDLDHRAGQIYDVNAHTVAAAVRDAGGEPRRYPRVGDDSARLESALRGAAADCDLVLTSGSTSASAADTVYRVVEETGERLLHGVAIKPGKPTLVGRIEGTGYVGLPGYPVSALTVFRALVAPAIRDATGVETGQETVVGKMAVAERYTEGRRRLLPVGLVEAGDDRLVYPVDKGSGATTSLVDADGTVTMPADAEELRTGESVTVDLFSPGTRPPSLLSVGEDDPTLAALLDRVERPRHLAFGARTGAEWLRDGVADVAVVAGEVDAEGAKLGGWCREWGLAVAPDGPERLVDLVGGGPFVNRPRGTALRAALDAALDEAGVDTGQVEGYGRTGPGYESPPRRVLAGDALAGLSLQETAAELGVEFVPLGEQRVTVVANPDRTAKPGVASLADALDSPEFRDR